MATPQIQLVCFDLGGVLIQLTPSWAHACQDAGVPLENGHADVMPEAIFEVVKRNEVGDIDCQGFAREVARIIGCSPDEVVRIYTAWLRGPFPGIGELVDQLAATDVQTACLSNTNEHHWQMMTTAGHDNHLPLERLDYRFASHEIRLRKPDHAIYAHVEQATGLPGESILFFDDNAENIAAARQCGWQACKIEHPGDPVQQMTQQLKAYNLT